MNSAFYLPRSLSDHDKIYTEVELLTANIYVVVLAEPGGGKTELMKSLARQLNTKSVTASKFAYGGTNGDNLPLLIDAFDELSKVDSSGIHKLLNKAESINPTHFFLSSRSSEWDNIATSIFEDVFGHVPLVVRLSEFDVSEQREIFDHHVPEEDFAVFQAEVARFDLETLLPNPQFLKLFADAYIESERHFTDKQSIFSQAVERLAKEANPQARTIHTTLSPSQKISISSEIFTKFLFSGAEGVCTSEVSEDRMYPLLASLYNGDAQVDGILATRLFKPGDSPDRHSWVHKIVAEYCAANYLTRRIADPADTLTLSKCLPILAPNSTVRDELRGLLGWMAALGNKSIEVSAIELDPYAVLANGDPSQLESSSKHLLIKQLKEIEVKDPYFRRGDFWRRFSVAGFFTPDVIDEIKPLLKIGNDGHLRDLILELMLGSPAIEQLESELRQLVLTAGESENTRLLANRCLLNVADDDHQSDLTVLISEATINSLQVAAETFKTLRPGKIDRALLVDFFHACATLYPKHKDRDRRVIGERYFIARFISELDLSTTELLLDELTKKLSCVCGKKSYECDCRNGISKIVGAMLDRFFTLATPPFDPIQVWQWIENLNFHGTKDANQSVAVKALQEDNNLRQGIIAHVFGRLTDRDKVHDTYINSFSNFQTHSGLSFYKDDYRYIVDLAFATDNPDLWSNFIAVHNYYNKQEQGQGGLRRHMREQALAKPLFMREWAKLNRARTKSLKQEKQRFDGRHNRRMVRRRKKKDEVRAKNIIYIAENRELVEGGRHWSCLVHFAEVVLMEPEKIESKFGNEMLVRNALRNCLDFIAPEIPDLDELAELQCASQTKHSEVILFAACVEIMRVKNNLEEVDHHLLRALRTNLNNGYSAPSQDELEALKTEIDRLIFRDNRGAETFLRAYLEPQLANPKCSHPEIWILRSDESFSHLRSTLSIEWLKAYRNLAFNPLDTLFEIAAQYGNRHELEEITRQRCAEFTVDWANLTGDKDIRQRRTFWLIRSWYFINDTPHEYWNYLKTEKNTVLILESLSGRMGHGDRPYWPKYTPSKIEAILDAFIDKWPKVSLPGSYGSESPREEKAYRFLTDLVWSFDSGEPDDTIPALSRLLDDPRFTDIHLAMKSIHASQMRKKALIDFEPPTPQEIVRRLDCDEVVTVEGLRQLVLEELQDFQKAINGGEFNSADRFYEMGKRLGEIRSTEIIAERLNLRLEPQGISVTPEHQLKGAKRSDFTATKMISGKRRLLVTEVKGQWHTELYTAASAQLYERYSIHPDAEQQGIFLVIWFDKDEKVAGRKHNIENAQDLRNSIEVSLPRELKGLIDVFVLDVSRPT